MAKKKRQPDVRQEAVRKLDAYRKLPELLTRVVGSDAAKQEAMRAIEEIVPPEELVAEAITQAKRIIPLYSPELFNAIEMQEDGDFKDFLYVQCLGLIGWRLMEAMGGVPKEIRVGIEQDCAEGVDRQLDVLRSIRDREQAGKRGNSASEDQ